MQIESDSLPEVKRSKIQNLKFSKFQDPQTNIIALQLLIGSSRSAMCARRSWITTRKSEQGSCTSPVLVELIENQSWSKLSQVPPSTNNLKMQNASKMVSRIPRICVRFNSSSSRAAVRSDWTKEQIKEIYDMPLMDLVFRASSVHRQYFNSAEVQQVRLLSHVNHLILDGQIFPHLSKKPHDSSWLCTN